MFGSYQALLANSLIFKAFNEINDKHHLSFNRLKKF